MATNTEGSCSCGAVRFRVTGPFESFFLCHCRRCRKDTGSAHAANLFSQAAELHWLRGQDTVRTYRVPHTRHRKSFCTICGSSVPHSADDGAGIVVPAGCLDSAIDLLPDAHIFCASRAEWDVRLEDIPHCAALPG